jgi:parallel beta-helix repeat protein
MVRNAYFAQMPGNPGEQPGAPGAPGAMPGPSQPPSRQFPQQQGPIPIKEGGSEKPDELVEEVNRKAHQKKIETKLLSYAVIAIIIVAAGAYLIPPLLKPSPVTTSTTTVAPQIFKISSCTVITKSGTYYITGNIDTAIQSGSCIDIMSPNVKLIGNGNGILGSGPFVITPPFSYGIRIDDANNVSLQGVSVSRFSYDVYLNRSSQSSILNSSIRNGTVSGVYLNSSVGDTLANDSISGISGPAGAISLQGGGSSTVTNAVIQGNAYYGVVIASTGNRFSKLTFLNNPVDLICSGIASFSSENNFTGSTCSVNKYCEFAYCSKVNLPANISSITLTRQITGCGGISSPGIYQVQTNLNLSSYANVSASPSVACITITASNVRLNCNNNAILHSGYGVSIPSLGTSLYNISISNCTFANYTHAINVGQVFGFNITNVRASGGGAAIYLQNGTQGTVSNSVLSRNTYGIYINGTSTGITFSNVTAQGNIYGVYAAAGQANIYTQSKFVNNSKEDLYCTASQYNSQSNIFVNNECGTTDCNWGTTCKTRTLPPISVYPLSGCSTIDTPGNYSLNADIDTQGNCFAIKASNVNLACNGHYITGGFAGNAVYGSGVNNITFNNCKIQNFNTALNFSNSNHLSFSNITINQSGTSVSITNSIFDSIVKVSSILGAHGFVFKYVNDSTLTNDSAISGRQSASGYLLNYSYNNLIAYDVASSNNNYGFAFLNSRNNQVSNNTAQGNLKSDYYCSANSGGLYAQQGGINNGVSKQNCIWLVEVQPIPQQNLCQSISSSDIITLTQDMVYPYGHACYTVYNTNSSSGNDTVINCMGHTIYATRGGTFVDDINSSNVHVSNCYLKYFTKPIIVQGPNAQIYNNTIGSSNASISLINAFNPVVRTNNITNASYGIFVQSADDGQIKNNILTNANISISVIGSASLQVLNNTVTGGSLGLFMEKSDEIVVGSNHLTPPTSSGIVCSTGSKNTSSSNVDFGDNVCSGNQNCNWMTSSPLCKV